MARVEAVWLERDYWGVDWSLRAGGGRIVRLGIHRTDTSRVGGDVEATIWARTADPGFARARVPVEGFAPSDPVGLHDATPERRVASRAPSAPSR